MAIKFSGEFEVKKKPEEVYEFLTKKMGKKIPFPDSGIGIKPISKTGTQRLVRMAIKYAIAHKKPSVTIVHKYLTLVAN